MSNLKHELFVCDCASVEHQLIISHIAKDPDFADFFVEVHLSPHRFWRRVWHAITYVCGHRSKYGDFEEIILSPDSARHLSKLITDQLAEDMKNESAE